MCIHRICGVVPGVKRYCYLFLDRLLEDVLLQVGLALEDAQPHTSSCPSYRHGEFPAHF
jgi:hypothetical protein